VHLFAVLGIALGGYLLYRGLSSYSLDAIVRSLGAVPVPNLLRALLFTMASYACLSIFDWLGLAYVGRPLSYRRALLASFVSLSIGHSIGFAGLSSGVIRYRFYQRWGLSAGDVAKLVLFCGTTVGLGLLILGAGALLLQPDAAARLTGLGPMPIKLFGAACLAAAAAYVVLSAVLRRALTIRGWTLEMPSLPLALGQVVIGPLNFACVAAALQALVSAVSDAGYATVASAYVTGNIMTLLVHAPGGLGVIETAIVYLVPSRADLIGPLVAFRAIYFLLPLAIGLIVFAATELRGRAAARRGAARGATGDA
jgi:uncharacterized membrane protein YbhN (UPF0104 family)